MYDNDRNDAGQEAERVVHLDAVDLDVRQVEQRLAFGDGGHGGDGWSGGKG